MPEPADREGDFRCEIVEYGIEESSKAGSQSVMVPLKVRLTAFWQHGEDGAEGQWFPWEQYDQESIGRVCVVKTDGQINNVGCESLIKNAGWDGDFSALDNKSWQPIPCQVRLQAEEYKGKTSYKIAFVNAYDQVPGGGHLKTVGTEKANALNARFGGSLRALRGTLTTAAKAAPYGKPAAPKPPASMPNNQQLTPAVASQPADEVPF